MFPRFLAIASLIVLLAATGTHPLRAAEASTPQTITWADLRFPTSPPRKVQIEGAKAAVETFNDQIPGTIRELDGRVVEIRGYMMPTELDGKDVRAFVLVVSQNVCCYGVPPDINEYIIVQMTGKPAPLLENVPIRITGKLHVGDIYENGFWTGIYALEGSTAIP